MRKDVIELSKTQYIIGICLIYIIGLNLGIILTRNDTKPVNKERPYCYDRIVDKN